MQRRIGNGGFSTVYSAVDERCNHEQVAAKITRPCTRTTVDSNQELVALSELSDLPHVVGMRRQFSCTCGDDECTVVVMDLARGNELFSIVQDCRRLNEGQARTIIQQVLEAVASMHRRGWVHRDLKLENIITEPRTSDSKIIDFGFAVRQVEAGPTCEGIIGTAHYVAPEVIWNRSYDGRAVDMFAVGVMLYVMLYGRYPFPRRGNFGVGPRMQASQKRAFSATYSFPHHPKISDEARNFIRSLLASEPTDRPTAEAALRDPFWLRHPDFEEPDDVPGEPENIPVEVPPVISPKPSPLPPDEPFHWESTDQNSTGTSPLAEWAQKQLRRLPAMRLW